MGTNCAPLIADFFLFCYERDFIMSLSDVQFYVLLSPNLCFISFLYPDLYVFEADALIRYGSFM